MDIAIEVEGLVKTFGDLRAVDGIDLQVRTGTVFGFLGPNGAGKTTAIRVLTTLLLPDGGRASVGGFDVVERPREVRRVIGLTGQYAAVDEMLSGEENLFMIGRLLGIAPAASRSRAREMLATFDLEDAAARLVRTYSGGMRRRLDLASSLVGRPKILFLDEPTTGLDPKSRNDLWDLIRRLASEGMTVLLTTQYLDEADRLAEELIVIDHGRVIASGTPDSLKRQVGHQVLEARPVDAANLPVTRQILEGLAASADGAQTEGGSVTVSIAERSALRQAIRLLDEAGVALDDLSLRRPSLDEVFLSLTGSGATDDPHRDAEESR